MTIGVVCGRKATDAALCEALEQYGFTLQIAQYQIPFAQWIPWIARRMREMGVMVLVGHVCLSAFLRLERFFARIQGKSLWYADRATVPRWSAVRSPRKFCTNEHTLAAQMRGARCILLTDSFRISSSVYKKLAAPCLQIVWGKAPAYMGDSGAFWAYAKGERDNVCVTVLVRGVQFRASRIVATIPVSTGDRETIRTIKIRQVVALEKRLPQIIDKFMARPTQGLLPRSNCMRVWRAPTLLTYWIFLRKGRLDAFPPYAFKEIV